MYKSRPTGFSTKLLHREPPHQNLNDIVSQLNSKLASLDNVSYALTFTSGVAATAALFSLLKAGDHILVASDVYGGTEDLIKSFLSKVGVENTFLTNLTDLDTISQSIKANTKMVFFETPSNPFTYITDMEELCRQVRKVSKDIIIANDNTFLTPYLQRPIEYGADINLYSLTKYMNGHSDVLMGALVMNCKKFYNEIRKHQSITGNVPPTSAANCRLVFDGLQSLVVRLRRIQKSSLQVAEYLESHPKVSRVFHPSLPSHPQHKLALKQSYGHSGILSFYIRDGHLQHSLQLLRSVKMIIPAGSLGGAETTMQIPAVTSHSMLTEEVKSMLGMTENLIRVSVGLEDPEELIEDFRQAFEKVHN